MAHALVSNAQITEGTGNPRTTSLNLASGTTLLVVLINTQSLTNRSGGNPTFNGVSLSGGSVIESSEGGIELWYMIGPPTGASYTLSIPNGGGADVSADISWYSAGTNYTSALRGSILTNTGSTVNPATATHNSCVSGDVLVAGVTSAANTFNPTAVSGTAQLYENDWGTQGSGSQYLLISSSGNFSVNWTFGTAASWAAISAVFYETPKPFVYSTGNLPISVTPASTRKREYVRTGALSISVTPAYERKFEKAVTGALTISVTPNSIYSLQAAGGEFVYDTANINIGITPSYERKFEKPYSGAVSISVTPSSSYSKVYNYLGHLNLYSFPNVMSSMGDSTVNDTQYIMDDILYASRFYNDGGAGVIRQLDVLPEKYIGVGGQTIRLGVYTDNSGVPDALVGDAGEVDYIGDLIWVGIPNLNFPVDNNTWYWLVCQMKTGEAARISKHYISAGYGYNCSYWVTRTYGAFPDPITSGGTYGTTTRYCLRAWIETETTKGKLEKPYSGNISVSFTPESSRKFDRVVSGALSISVTPSGSLYAQALRHTVAPSGQGGDFTSLEDALNHIESVHNLISENRFGEILIFGDWSGGADTTAASTFYIPTDRFHNLRIFTNYANRATAKGWDNNRYRLSVSNAVALVLGYGGASGTFVDVDGLQIEVPTVNGNYQNAISFSNIASPSYFRLSNLRIRGASGNSSYVQNGISAGDTDIYVDIYNVIATDFGYSVSGSCSAFPGGANTRCFNCIAYHNRFGFDKGSGDWLEIYDSVAFDNTVDVDGTPDVAEYNASDDNFGSYNVDETAGGTKTWADNFVDYANGDFRLKRGAPLIGAGGGEGASLFTVDIDGHDRSDWSVGPSEEIVAFGTSALTVSVSLTSSYRKFRLLTDSIFALGMLKVASIDISESSSPVVIDGWIYAVGSLYGYEKVSWYRPILTNLSVSFTPNSIYSLESGANEFVYDTANIDISITPSYTYKRDYATTGALSVTLTPESTRKFDRVVAGAISISITPSYEVKREYVKTGDIPITLTPGSTRKFDRLYAGALNISVVLESDYSYFIGYSYAGDLTVSFTPSSTRIRDYKTTGSISVTFTPESIRKFDRLYSGDLDIVFTLAYERKYEMTSGVNLNIAVTPSYERKYEYRGISNLSVNITPAYERKYEKVYSGDLDILITPAYERKYEKAYSGDLDVSILPSSTRKVDYAVDGALSVLFTPSYTVKREYVKTGALTISVTPTSIYYIEGTRVYQGNITVSIVPSSTRIRDYKTTGAISISVVPSVIFKYERLYAGSLSVSLTPSSTYLVARVYPYSGNLSIGVLPSSTRLMIYTPVSYGLTVNFAPSSTRKLERIYSGNIDVTFSPTSTYRLLLNTYFYSGNLPIGIGLDSVRKFDRLYSGDLTILVTPESLAEFYKAYSGNIPITVIPSYTYTLEKQYLGNLNIVFTPEVEIIRDYVYSGNLPLTVMPESFIRFMATLFTIIFPARLREGLKDREDKMRVFNHESRRRIDGE